MADEPPQNTTTEQQRDAEVSRLRAIVGIDDIADEDFLHKATFTTEVIPKLDSLTSVYGGEVLDKLAVTTQLRTTALLENLVSLQLKKENTPKEITWLDAFLPTIVAVATFGGSITFTLIPTALATPNVFSVNTVTVLLSLAWLFFVLALGIASGAGLALAFRRDEIHEALLGKETKDANILQSLAIFFITIVPISLLLQELVLIAFLFLALVVIAYSKVVGIIAVAAMGFSISGAPILWRMQVSFRGANKKSATLRDLTKSAPPPTVGGGEDKTSGGDAGVLYGSMSSRNRPLKMRRWRGTDLRSHEQDSV